MKRITWNLALSLDHKQLHSGAENSPDMYRRYLATHVIPRCHLVFSTVVADGQFSTLGTVLLSTLARLTNAIGLDKELKSPAQTVTFKATPSHPPIEGSEDFGEILSRNKNLPCPDEILEEASSKAEGNFKSTSTRPESKMDEAVTTHNKKKKKKKKDAIDSLFDGLL